MNAESVHIRQLTQADQQFGMQLHAAVGWNQTRRDWQRMMDYQPEGCFLAEWEGELAGTATTTSYGADLAWIGMMLVRADLRRKGVATALMRRCLDYLSDRGVATIKLDASADGRPVYLKIGFEDEWPINRWLRPGDDSCDGVPTGGEIAESSLKFEVQDL